MSQKNCIDGIRLLKIETRTVIVFSLFPIRRRIAWKLELSSFVSFFRQSITVIVIQQTIDEHWMYFWIYLTAIILNWEQNCSIETQCARNILEHTSRADTVYNSIPYILRMVLRWCAKIMHFTNNVFDFFSKRFAPQLIELILPALEMKYFYEVFNSNKVQNNEFFIPK